MDEDGILAGLTAPPASQEMFKKLADKTNMFTDPMGSETLGAVNRAIVGAPVDAIDMVGRAGDALLRGASSAGSGIMKALGVGDAMAERFGRDVYQLGMVAPVATGTMAPVRPRGKSNKTLVLEAQKDKVKSPAAKAALDENIEATALRDAFDDAADDITAVMQVDDPDIAFDVIQDAYFFNRDPDVGKGMKKGDAIADAIMQNNTEGFLTDVVGPMLRRLDEDYGFRAGDALKRRTEGAASRRALETQARLAKQPQEPVRVVSLEEATRMQNEISGMGLPDRSVPQKPNLKVIEGGKE